MSNCSFSKMRECISTKYKTNAAVIGWIMASFFYFYEVILRVSPSVMTEQLMEYFQISATSLGWLSTSYYMSYFILQIPCGMIVDHYGPRRVITISSLICVAGTVRGDQGELHSVGPSISPGLRKHRPDLQVGRDDQGRVGRPAA